MISRNAEEEEEGQEEEEDMAQHLKQSRTRLREARQKATKETHI